MHDVATSEHVVTLSVLVVTYNRFSLLEPTIRSLERALAKLPVTSELVVADDCSDEPHRTSIDRLPNVRVTRTIHNSGIGANVNNGLARCRGKYILQVQDDWPFEGDSVDIESTLAFLDHNMDVGIVQLTPVGTDLPSEVRQFQAIQFQVFRNDGLPWARRNGLRPYSDNPHIKRRAFIESLGEYRTMVPMTVCENDFKQRVAGQRTWKVAMLVRPALFSHAGADASFNPGGRRHVFVRLLLALPLGKSVVEPLLRRFAYRMDHIAAQLFSRGR